MPSVPDITLRLAVLSDLGTVVQIRNAAILALAPDHMTLEAASLWTLSPRRPEKTRTAIDVKRLWLAYEGTDPIAWFEVRDDFLDGLYVIPARWRSGVGSTLLGVVEIMIKDKGFESAKTLAAPPAAGFYEKQGYKATGPSHEEHGTPMMKVLTPLG